MDYNVMTNQRFSSDERNAMGFPFSFDAMKTPDRQGGFLIPLVFVPFEGFDFDRDFDRRRDRDRDFDRHRDHDRHREHDRDWDHDRHREHDRDRDRGWY
jgi:hypothetical protein